MKMTKIYLLAILLITIVVGIVYLVITFSNNQFYARRLISAINDQDLNKLEKVLQENRNVDAKPSVICIDCMGDLPALHTAAKNQNLEAVKLLVEYGADVNNKNAVNSFSPLRVTLNSQWNGSNFNIARYLIQKGADINDKDRYGNTALSLSLRWNHPYSSVVDKEDSDFIVWLIEQGADVKRADQDDNLIFQAAYTNHVHVVEYLVEHNLADLNEQDQRDRTSLMIASQWGAKEVVEYLLSKEANKDLQNKDGKTALDLAIEGDHSEIVELLLSDMN